MLRLITFGGLRIENGTVVNGAANPRSRLAILAVIAMGGDAGVRREKLTALFWPDSSDQRARNALRQALFVLKRDVGGAELLDGVTDLRLNSAAISADVSDFDRAIDDGRPEEAVGLYVGGFLDGVYLREAPEFERWADEQRQRFSHAYGRALEALGTRATASGDIAGAVRWWERRSLHEPLSAKVALAYMEALAANGERERAIQHAAMHGARVHAELELEPDAEVEARAASLGSTSRSAPRVRVAGVPEYLPLRDPAPEHADVAVAAGDSPTAFDGQTPPSWLRRPRIVSVILVSAAIIAVGVGRAWQPGDSSTVRPRVQVASIATGRHDSLLDKLASATSEEVQRSLVGDGSVDVIDRLRGTPGPASDWSVATQLEARNDSVVARTTIVHGTTGVTLADLDPVAAPRAGSYALVARVREGVRGALAALTDTLYQPWARARSRPPAYAAFREFMQGLDAIVQQGFEPAAAFLRRAMELDPDFVEAKVWYVEQADALGATDIDSVLAAARLQYDRLGAFDQLALDRVDAFVHGHLEATYTAARRLHTLAPTVQDAQFYLAHAAMATRRYREVIRVVHGMDRTGGWLAELHQPVAFDLAAHRFLGDYRTALTEWRALRARNRTSFAVCREGIPLLAVTGDTLALEALVPECASLPDAPRDAAGAWEMAGRMLRSGGHAAAAKQAFERALAQRPSSADARAGLRMARGVVLCELGQWEAAYAEFSAAARQDALLDRTRLAVAAAHVGDSAVVLSALQFMEGLPAGQRGTGAADEARAFVYAALGRPDDAIPLLQRARDRGHAPGFMQWYVRFELAPLRGDPRFQALIAPQ